MSFVASVGFAQKMVFSFVKTARPKLSSQSICAASRSPDISRRWAPHRRPQGAIAFDSAISLC